MRYQRVDLRIRSVDCHGEVDLLIFAALPIVCSFTATAGQACDQHGPYQRSYD